MVLLGGMPSEHLPPGALVPDMLRTLPELQYPPDFNAVEELSTRNCARGLSSALADHTRTGPITYGELTARVNQLAAGLRDTGVRRGNRVLITLPDGPGVVYAVWSAGMRHGDGGRLRRREGRRGR